MLDQSLETFLDQLSSSEPTPGGGAAVGVVLGLGAALTSMVVQITLPKEAHQRDKAWLMDILERAEALRVSATQAAQDDEVAFASLMDAYRMSNEDQQAKQQAVQEGLAAASRPPLESARLAAQLATLCDELAGRSSRGVASDVEVAAHLSLAAVRSAAANVAINTASIDDETVRQSIDQQLSEHVDHVETTILRVLTRLEEESHDH